MVTLVWLSILLATNIEKKTSPSKKIARNAHYYDIIKSFLPASDENLTIFSYQKKKKCNTIQSDAIDQGVV